MLDAIGSKPLEFLTNIRCKLNNAKRVWSKVKHFAKTTNWKIFFGRLTKHLVLDAVGSKPLGFLPSIRCKLNSAKRVWSHVNHSAKTTNWKIFFGRLTKHFSAWRCRLQTAWFLAKHQMQVEHRKARLIKSETLCQNHKLKEFFWETD